MGGVEPPPVGGVDPPPPDGVEPPPSCGGGASSSGPRTLHHEHSRELHPCTLCGHPCFGLIQTDDTFTGYFTQLLQEGHGVEDLCTDDVEYSPQVHAPALALEGHEGQEAHAAALPDDDDVVIISATTSHIELLPEGHEGQEAHATEPLSYKMLSYLQRQHLTLRL